jgi:hypothetical protein
MQPKAVRWMNCNVFSHKKFHTLKKQMRTSENFY